MKKKIKKIHRWLGFISGPIVFIVALTGAIYAFQYEIQDALYAYRFYHATNEPHLAPSKIIDIANDTLPNKHLHSVEYLKDSRSTKVIYFSVADEYYYTVYINPETGRVLNIKDELKGFFPFVLEGHMYLWLPIAIGRTVVSSATLVFGFVILSGLYLWWPKKNQWKKNKFVVKKKARWRRRNYDLHSILGMYASVVALFLIVTGLVFGFIWFKKAYYYTISGGDEYVDYYNPESKYSGDTIQQDDAPIDLAWGKMNEQFSDAHSIELHPAESQKEAIAVNANPTEETYYDVDYYYFDPNTMDALEVNHAWNSTRNRSFADFVMRANYDIHVGSILGLPGKILVFIISLLIASLPITGFLMWKGRKFKKKKKRL